MKRHNSLRSREGMNPLYLSFLVPHLNYSLQFGAPLKKKGCKYIRCRELSRVLPVMSSAECYLFCWEEGMSWGAVCRHLPWNHQGHGTRLFVSCSPTMFNRNKLKKRGAVLKGKGFSPWGQYKYYKRWHLHGLCGQSLEIFHLWTALSKLTWADSTWKRWE